MSFDKLSEEAPRISNLDFVLSSLSLLATISLYVLQSKNLWLSKSFTNLLKLEANMKMFEKKWAGVALALSSPKYSTSSLNDFRACET